MQDALARYRVPMGQKVIALDLGILAKNERFRVVRTTSPKGLENLSWAQSSIFPPARPSRTITDPIHTYGV